MMSLQHLHHVEGVPWILSEIIGGFWKHDTVDSALSQSSGSLHYVALQRGNVCKTSFVYTCCL